MWISLLTIIRNELHIGKGDDSSRKNNREYVAIIIPRNHPYAKDILDFFDEGIAMFNTMKP